MSEYYDTTQECPKCGLHHDTDDEWCDGLSASTGSDGLTNEQFIGLYSHVNDPKNGWVNLGSNQQNGES